MLVTTKHPTKQTSNVKASTLYLLYNLSVTENNLKAVQHECDEWMAASWNNTCMIICSEM